MSRSLSNRLLSKGALAAATVTAAAAGITGLASASSISHTGPGSYNSISSGYGSDWQGYHGGKTYTVHDWSWNDKDWDRECQKWNPKHVKKHDNGNHYGWYKHHDNKKDHDNKKHYGYNDKKHDYKGHDDYKDRDYGHDKGHDYDRKDYGHGGHKGHGGYGGQVTLVSYDNEENYVVRNDTDVNIDNNVDQVAVSGDATSSYNTHGGSVSSGNAYNESTNEFNVEVENSTSLPSGGGGGWDGFDWGSLSHTGYNSYNRIDYSNEVNHTVTNNTDVDIDNNVSQTAVSGDATSKYNTWGGHVSSGDAVNVSNNSFNVSVRNE